jgi:hypothetical protein
MADDWSRTRERKEALADQCRVYGLRVRRSIEREIAFGIAFNGFN